MPKVNEHIRLPCVAQQSERNPELSVQTGPVFMHQ